MNACLPENEGISVITSNNADPWVFDSFITQTALRTDLPLRPATAKTEFFRVYEGVALDALSIRSEGDQVIIEWPLECDGCTLEESADASATWTPAAVQPEVVNGRYRVVFPSTQSPQYLRLVAPSR